LKILTGQKLDILITFQGATRMPNFMGIGLGVSKQLKYNVTLCTFPFHAFLPFPSFLFLSSPTENKNAQLTLTNPRDAKACKNCSNSTCFVSFHRIPFHRISNYWCI